HAWSIALIDVPPLCTALLASVFIYRHTARRRKIQAALTAIVVLLLCVLALIAVSRYFFYSQLSH
ncbi:MAG TPA: hypothetical protein VN920_07010, partial [Pyrinomonadaceae bacterium]|nr:hypothetical protein [Pyrinomonadaceae bacterium]